MATRFAGDFFGIPLVEEKQKSSMLLDYYPELRSVKKQDTEKAKASTDEGARMYGGAQAAPTFVGFKKFEVGDKTQRAAPVFAGFKTFEQIK